MLQRTLPAGFIAPCLPTKTEKLPSGSDWLQRERKKHGARWRDPTTARSPDWLKMKNSDAPAGEARGGGGLGQRKMVRKTVKGHCPNCGPNRNAEIVANHESVSPDEDDWWRAK